MPTPVTSGRDATSGRLRWSDPYGSSHASGVVIQVSNNVSRLGKLIGSGTRPRMDAGLTQSA